MESASDGPGEAFDSHSADRWKYVGGPGEDWARMARRGDEAMP